MAFRTIFFGSDCLYSQVVLESLIAAGIKVAAVWLAGKDLPGVDKEVTIKPLLPHDAHIADNDPNSLRIVSPFIRNSVLQTSWDHGIPLYVVQRIRAAETAAVLKSLAPEVGCVACFPRLVPESLLSLPRFGFLNVHPSLLPNYRGPSPIFWQFWAGERRMGVTVHWMDAEFDTGPIAAQRAVTLPDGTSETDATALLARVGGRLLADTVNHVIQGEIPYQTQPAGGDYHPYPQAEDFRISTEWTAQRVYNFMRGTAVWGIPYRLEVDGDELLLSDALSWSDHAKLDVPLIREEETVRIQCSPGVVRARLAG